MSESKTAPEIEITPEMIEAGVDALAYANKGPAELEPDPYDETVIAVYRAMERARQTTR